MARISEEDIKLLLASGNFDADWYLQEYPDVAMTGLRPEEHYLWIGRTLNRKASSKALSSLAWSPLNWCVMTSPHTLFLANMIASNLQRHGWMVDVTTEAPSIFSHDFYFVLCPQIFDRLPPGEKRICFQLEQSVSSRWFTSTYLSTLENSAAVLDYSLQNIEFLAEKGVSYPHVFHLPIGAHVCNNQIEVQEKKYDILFYGDFKSSIRRREFIEKIKNKYKLLLVDDLFGDDIHELIKQSRFVLNIHYYQNALLEMPRIQECLSLGTPVISEATGDMRDYPHLKDAVTFFKEGSVEDMERAVALAMAGGQNAEGVAASVALSQRHFEFMFDRFLLARDFLPIYKADELQLPNVFNARMVSLSLPETVRRRRIFEAENIKDCVIFDGMRKSPGWLGCGMSYKVLCAGALQRDKEKLIVVEDDVLLDEHFEENLEIVTQYLEGLNGDWDIFSGVIASLHDEAKVSRVERFRGIDFVTIDKMTSMVFNIYSRRAMQLIAEWSPLNAHVESNAVDRYLEQSNLKIVVAHPYIAGHREEVHSTLWGFENTEYVNMINESEDHLGRLKDEWLRSPQVALT
ncbi:hypothetical protein BH11PSE5_BH11PSE5_06480 [soil metagenome]|uniref:glycosyltransferase family protein n=1 Tax=Sphingobium sp. BS19 TaxID=3018973 RepID=UPI0022EEAA21|nr:glycosyltransferase family 25 protein [Sphingobium sp. BS19]GLJ00345.1 hypothetical protein Sbs19_41620 [Sphingobium sp. BS19]